MWCVTTTKIFSYVLSGWGSELFEWPSYIYIYIYKMYCWCSISITVMQNDVRLYIHIYHLPIYSGSVDGFVLFPEALELNQTQTAASRIWTWAANSISNDDSNYAKHNCQGCQWQHQLFMQLFFLLIWSIMFFLSFV